MIPQRRRKLVSKSRHYKTLFMKNLLFGSIALTLFAISITLFQISCSKNAVAQTTTYILVPATTSTLGGVIVGNGLSITSNGTLSVNPTAAGLTQLNKIVYDRFNYKTNTNDGIYTANYDGTNQTKINIVIPGIANPDIGSPRLSPDGSTVFFQAQYQIAGVTSFNVYSCKIDGSNVKQVLDGGSGQWEYELGGAN